MRYYTKEWYDLMQCQALEDYFQKIPEKEYSTADIRILYEKKLKKQIASEKKL